MGFRLVLNKIGDLERCNGHYIALFYQIWQGRSITQKWDSNIVQCI